MGKQLFPVEPTGFSKESGVQSLPDAVVFLQKVYKILESPKKFVFLHSQFFIAQDTRIKSDAKAASRQLQ
jgi:hypothetical protein